MSERELSVEELRARIIERGWDYHDAWKRVASRIARLEDIVYQKGKPTHEVVYGKRPDEEPR